MHLDAHYCSYLIMDLAIKARQRGDDHHHFEFLFVLIGSAYSLYQGLGYRVLHRNEKLIFNVDKFPRMIDELDISFKDRPLILPMPKAKAPHRRTSQKLMLLFSFFKANILFSFSDH